MRTFGETMRLVMDAKGLKPVDLWRDSDVLTQPYISKLLTNRVVDPTFTKACASAAVEPKQPRAARRSWETYMRWDMGVEQSRIEQMMGHTLGGVTGAHYDKPTARLFADAVGEAFARKPFIR